MVDTVDDGCSFSGKPRQNQRGSCADVRCHDRCADEIRNSDYDRLVSRHADIGAHTVQFGRMDKPVFENRLPDERNAIGDSETGHEWRLKVGGKSRVRHRRYIDGGKFPGAFNDAIYVQKTLVVAFAVAMLGAIFLGLFFRYTRAGLGMRATAEEHELARSTGINVSRIFGLSWAIAGIIATAGGVLLAMLVGISTSLSTVVLVAFPALLLGGLESLPGAIVGGVAVGLAQGLVGTFKAIEIRNSSEIAPYVLLLIVLLIRPEGLFGQKRIERI